MAKSPAKAKKTIGVAVIVAPMKKSKMEEKMSKMTPAELKKHKMTMKGKC